MSIVSELSTEKRGAIESSLREGAPMERISRTQGVQLYIVRTIAREIGVVGRPGRPLGAMREKKIKKEELAALLAKNMNGSDCARELKVSKQAIAKARKRWDL